MLLLTKFFHLAKDHGIRIKIQISFLKQFFTSGKTSLADSLVASNGIISSRQAGKVSLNSSYVA